MMNPTVTRMPALLSALLAAAVIALSLLTATMRSRHAETSQEAERLYRRSRALEGVLQEVQAEVRNLRVPTAVEQRLHRMRTRRSVQVKVYPSQRKRFYFKP